MHRSSVFIHLSTWIAAIGALVAPIPEAHQAERRDIDLTVGPERPNGFVTFKLVQKPSKVQAPLVGKLARENIVPGVSDTHDNAIITNRDNNYKVVPAQDPTVSNAAGILQDGTDFSYFVEAQLGSKKKPLYMLLDTGASTTWVMGAGCTSKACQSHNSFGPEDSETYEDTGKTYSVEYGTGSVSGHVVTDTMSVAGLSVSLSFGVANVTSDDFTSFPFDGIMGLSMAPDTWLSAVKNAKLTQSNMFGVSLARNSDGTNDGEIALGAPNPAKFTGDISYTPLNSGTTWTIPFDDIAVDGKPVGLTDRAAYIDTGTSLIFGPPDDVAALYKTIPGSSSSGGTTYTVPCDSTVPVAFTFSGKSWTISSKDLISGPDGQGVCTGNIYGVEYVPNAWLLGDTFLKNVYSVFDPDQRRIGFAAKAMSSPPSTSSSSTGSGSTSSSTVSGTPSATSGPSTTSGPGGMGLNGHETASPDTSPAQTGGPDPTDAPSSAHKFSTGNVVTLASCFWAICALFL